jgi:hypothetical protein
MYLLIYQELARQHRAELERAASQAAARSAAHRPAAQAQRFDFLSFLSRRLGVRDEVPLTGVSPREIRPALLTTLNALHRGGLVSDYDEAFVDRFVETFEEELVHQAACRCG